VGGGVLKNIVKNDLKLGEEHIKTAYGLDIRLLMG
jgi:hypothetical protein